MWVNEAMACLKTRRNFANKKMERRLAAWHAVNEDRKSRSRCVNGEKRRCQRRKRALQCGIKLREWASFLWLSQVKHKVNQMNLKPLHSVISGYTPNARSERTFHRVKRLQWSERKETKCWRTASFKELGKKFPADEREFVPTDRSSGTRRVPFLKRIVKFRRFSDNKSAIEKCGIQLFFIIIWGEIIQQQQQKHFQIYKTK